MGYRSALADPPQQLSFGWLAPGPSRYPRPSKLSKLLLLTKPPDLLADEIFQDAERHAQGRTTRRAYPAELLHVSLLCIGAFQTRPDWVISRVHTALRSFSARPIAMKMDMVSHFGNPKSLVLKSAAETPEMTCLVRRIQGELHSHNAPNIRQSDLTPHITIIYGCGEMELMRVRKPYCWIMDEIELVFSHYGEGWHEECGRWRLHDNAMDYGTAAEQMNLPEL